MNYFDSNKFSKRASQLFGTTGQKEISTLTGISQAVISSIKTNSIKSPSADTIYSIARSYNVSTDWLLGLTDVKSTDKATKELCDTLGLNESAINALKENNTYKNDVINFLFEQDAKNKVFLDTLRTGDTTSDFLLYRQSLLSLMGSLLEIQKRESDVYLTGDISDKAEFCINIKEGNCELATIVTNSEYSFCNASLNGIMAQEYTREITNILLSFILENKKGNKNGKR